MRIDPNKYTTWNLSNMAACGSPDRPDGIGMIGGDPASCTPSPGATFLRRVADDLAERFAWCEANNEPADADDIAHEVADAAVPIYTADLWATFTDLAGYSEDPTELGWTMGPHDGGDLDGAARIVLYMIGRRLCDALVAEAEEGADDE